MVCHLRVNCSIALTRTSAKTTDPEIWRGEAGLSVNGSMPSYIYEEDGLGWAEIREVL